MKKNKKYVFIGFGLIFILIIGFLYFCFNKQKEIQLIIPADKNYNVESTDSTLEIHKNIKDEKTPVSVSPEVKNIKVSLVVLDKKYGSEIKDGSSVFDAMKNIEDKSTSSNPFSFKYTNNANMGSFITEINGAIGTKGKYWIYYVNGKKASIGVSKFLLKEGDIISWSQEGL